MATPALPHAVDAVLRRFPRLARTGSLQADRAPHPAFCPDAERLRACARRLGALPTDDLDRFGGLLRERLARSLGERPARDWDATYPGLAIEERAREHTASAARRAAVYGGLSAAGAHVGEAVTVLTDGLAAPLCVPAVMASLTGEVVATAKLQIDLVFDLASIYGAPFDVTDAAELAAIFDLAFGACSEHALFARLGRAMIGDAMFGLLPFVGVPVAAMGSHRATMRVGEVARGVLRRRVALREVLAGPAFEGAHPLLVEGAWLLAVADGLATSDELAVVAAIAASGGREASRLVERLDRADEASWLEALRRLDARERPCLMEGLCVTAGLFGPTRHPERSFLARAAAALGEELDLDRVHAVRSSLDRGHAPSVELRRAGPAGNGRARRSSAWRAPAASDDRDGSTHAIRYEACCAARA